jgi:murein DD-endopeptidase MepM/ murein hydrolase activator NlpD
MSKVKYKFNPKSLTYDKVSTPFKQRLFSIMKYAASGLFFAFLTFAVAYKYLDSFKNSESKRENAELILQYDLLNKKLNEVTAVLGDIEERDNNIYRAIFETELIPDDVRKAGYGGVNRYKYLEGFNSSDLMIRTFKQIDRISKQLYIQSKSFDEVATLVKNKEKLLASIPAIQPVSNQDLKRMASGWGYRIHPIYKTKMFHEGMDFTAKTGTEIYATGDGVVIKATSKASGYGKHVKIDHGFGYKTLYGHMSKFIVRRGQKVKRGEVIGYVGNTGRSTGPHVHYEIIKDNRKINPINYYYNDLSPEQYRELIERSNQSTQSFD